ncbi:hypothetical protein BgiBS90_013070, partial [Biomphalaria glabrata]
MIRLRDKPRYYGTSWPAKVPYTDYGVFNVVSLLGYAANEVDMNISSTYRILSGLGR